MPDQVITKQPQDAIALGRNTLAVAECDVHTTTVNGKPCKALTVPILSCSAIWLRVQREAEAWIAPGGKLIEDNLARNRRINQAYAQLWQEDHRFQWAGLAAFASKQVGCGLLHAADNVKKSVDEAGKSAYRHDVSSSAGAAAVNLVPNVVTASSAYMYRQLTLGNTILFLDIYPLHRFYTLRGLKHMRARLEVRSTIRDNAIWPVDKNKISFGWPHREILEAFSLIDSGRVADSVKALAQHEQVNILQGAIYNDLSMQAALSANQFAWATGFPAGTAAEIQLTLSAECRDPTASRSISFSKNKYAKLYDKDQRMKFVNQAADRFNILLNGPSKNLIEFSLEEIASGGSAQ